MFDSFVVKTNKTMERAQKSADGRIALTALTQPTLTGIQQSLSGRTPPGCRRNPILDVWKTF